MRHTELPNMAMLARKKTAKMKGLRVVYAIEKDLGRELVIETAGQDQHMLTRSVER